MPRITKKLRALIESLDIKIIPPGVKVDTKDKRVYALVGPVSGTKDDWHLQMIIEIATRDDDCYIACPREYGEDHPLYKYRQDGQNGAFANLDAWERFYNFKSLRHGCMVVHLAAPDPEYLCSGKPYGVGTYGELGRWGSMAIRQSMNMTIGADADFPGLDRVHFNLYADWKHRYTDTIDTAPSYPPLSPLNPFRIYDTIPYTAEMAVNRARMF